MAKIYPKKKKERYLLIVAIAFLLGTLATTCLADDVTVKMADTVKVGRQYVAEITAEYEGQPADAILVDIDGELDYNLFENNSKLCYTPTAAGTVRIKLVAIWFKLQRATQSFVKVEVTSGESSNPPPTKPTPDKDFAALETSVAAIAATLPDPSGKQSMAEAYLGLSEAVSSRSVYSQTYFEKGYKYDFASMANARESVNLAISRTIAAAKARSQVSDSVDWADNFLIPVKALSEQFDLDDRATLAGFLKAVANGLAK
jgi:hypothetical protein